MRTPVIMIFLVCVLIMGIVALAVYDYKRRGFRTEGPGISKSEADTLKRTRAKGDELFEKQDYESAIMKYEQASEMAPRDAHIYNDLGAAYYRLGLTRMEPPMEEEDFDFGVEVDARIEGLKALEMVKDKLKTIRSGIITAVVNGEADRDRIEAYVHSLGHYVHVEEEEGAEEEEREFWLTIVTGETKDALLNAEKKYMRAMSIKYVKDKNGRRYSNYSAASRNMGTLYFRMGRKKEAVTQWRRALQLEPTDAELRVVVDKYEQK